MFRNLSLMTLFVLCAGAMASEKSDVQAKQGASNAVIAAVVLENDGTAYGYFVDPQADRVWQNIEIDADCVKENVNVEASSTVKASFEPIQAATEETRVFAPPQRSWAYETRRPLFNMSNPNSRPAPAIEAKQGE